MIPILLGAGAVLTALKLMNEDEEKASAPLLSQPEVSFKEDVQFTSEDKKNDKAFSTKLEHSILELREYFEGLIPNDFNFWITTESDNSLTVYWQTKKANAGTRVGRLINENLVSLIEDTRQVDWKEERALAKQSDQQFKEFCKQFQSISGGGFFD